MLNIRAIVLSLTLLSSLPSFAATAAWEKLNDKDGVETYSRPPASNGVVSFKGVAVLDAPVDDVLNAMKDNSTAAGWMPMVGERRDLRVISPTHRIEYTHMEMPWPATDRYYVSESIISSLPDSGVLITVQSVKNLDPSWAQPDLILADFRPSQFRLHPLEDGRTQIVFEVHTSAGGTLPTWLVSMGQQSWPHDFVLGLRGELARRTAH